MIENVSSTLVGFHQRKQVLSYQNWNMKQDVKEQPRGSPNISGDFGSKTSASVKSSTAYHQRVILKYEQETWIFTHKIQALNRLKNRHQS